ncbi:hypothetical protein [Pantanalinema rosaneae]|uniref:hypothetical protein n=1 Tax=Pantanalinema rosaneae TaxID=1620701 RepID=UPI003D6F2ED9
MSISVQSRRRAHAQETQYPLEMVLEMAIAGFLDNEAITFADCRPSQIESGSSLSA